MAAVGLSVASTAGLVALFASGKTAGAGSESAGSAAIIRTNAAAAPAGTAAPTTSAAPATTAAQATNTQGASPRATTVPATAAPTTAAPVAAPTVVDGAVYSNRWGNVQVEATFDGSGNLTDVVALQTPNDRGRSIEINNYAVPALTSEALSAQSASIDSVSGATYTSNDYAKSLQSAIDAARAAGVTSIA
jgi:uncharacterized protein with FMN-binding domain